MQSTQVPAKFPVPFANSGSRNVIPVFSQVAVTPGAASLTDGFPPLTMTPPSGGGVAPFGQDFNGILYQITQNLQWFNAGGPVKYDASFAASVGGYPRGTILVNAATPGVVWICTTDNNTSNPDTGGAGWAAGSVTGLGFTPVQQGTGVGQSPNVVKMGYSAAGKVKVTIDITDFGAVAFEAWALNQFMAKGVGWGGRVYQVCNLTPGQGANNTLSFTAATAGWLMVVASANVGGTGIQPCPVTNGPIQAVWIDGVNVVGDSVNSSMSHSAAVPLTAGSHSILQSYFCPNVTLSGGVTQLNPTGLALSYIFVGN